MSGSVRACHICHSTSVKHLSDCFDGEGKKICELWYCSSCRKFYPDSVLIDPGDDASGAERRRHERYNVNFVMEVIFSDAVKHGPLIATVINASSGGVCFLYPDPIHEGTTGRFRISLPSAPESFEALGRIVRCIKTPDESYGVAVEFTEVDANYRVMLERYVSIRTSEPVGEEAAVAAAMPDNDSKRPGFLRKIFAARG